MKFDYVIGNPPYQEQYNGKSTGANSVYDKFMSSAYEISDRVEMITPARFLFNAGSTPKAWNEEMLNDAHFKVKFFEQDSSKIFANTDIKGGVVITYHDKTQNYGAIETFTPYPELNSIFHKVKNNTDFKSISDIIVSSFSYHFTKKMHEEHQYAAERLSKGHAFDLKSNVFEKLPEIFLEKCPNDNEKYLKVLGRKNNERVFSYIRRDYINDNVINLEKYKIFIPKANGTGTFGELISTPIIEEPNTASTETFLSIGAFNTRIEAENVKKYVSTKFARTLLGVLKITQDITPSKWFYVPLQDFTPDGDINWNKSVTEIDQQLYRKYGLSSEEISFIENNVKEMD